MEVSEDSGSSDDQIKPQVKQHQEINTNIESYPHLQIEASYINVNESHSFQSALETEGLENIDDEDLGDKKANKAFGGSGSTGVTSAGRGITLQMLLEDNILQAKEGSMSLEYMGQKFNGDLLPDGKIFSAEVQEVFSSPSAWALRCKKMVNPEQKYGCGWSSVRYCGRPLDVYKNQWMRKRRLEQEVGGNSTPEENAIVSSSIQEPVVDIKLETESSAVNRKLVKHETLGNRANIEDRNLLVEPISFPEVGKLQPFLVTISTAAFMIMEIHCSLSRSEVVGYLGGLWDLNSNTLTVKHALPCLSRLGDGKRGQVVLTKIAQEMESLELSVVGWYHSHPFSPSAPTIQDIDAQLEHQLKLKGTGDQGYRPCIAFIASPFFNHANESKTTSPNLDHMACFWISPPPESRPQEVGRPMAMQYTLHHDPTCVDREFYANIEACLAFYENAPDCINLEENWTNELSLLDKLKASLSASIPNTNIDDLKVFELLDNFMKKNSGKDQST